MLTVPTNPVPFATPCYVAKHTLPTPRTIEASREEASTRTIVNKLLILPLNVFLSLSLFLSFLFHSEKYPPSGLWDKIVKRGQKKERRKKRKEYHPFQTLIAPIFLPVLGQKFANNRNGRMLTTAITLYIYVVILPRDCFRLLVFEQTRSIGRKGQAGTLSCGEGSLVGKGVVICIIRRLLVWRGSRMRGLHLLR